FSDVVSGRVSPELGALAVQRFAEGSGVTANGRIPERQSFELVDEVGEERFVLLLSGREQDRDVAGTTEHSDEPLKPFLRPTRSGWLGVWPLRVGDVCVVLVVGGQVLDPVRQSLRLHFASDRAWEESLGEPIEQAPRSSANPGLGCGLRAPIGR